MSALPPTPRLLTRADLGSDHDPPRRWLWDGFLGPGLVTLFSSRWKAGKTTLLGMLLARMAEGGALAGGAVAKGTALVISEEPKDVWRERCRALGIGDQVRWILRPFRGPPTPGEWAAFMRDLDPGPADLVAVDPLAMVLPAHAENQASAVLEALDPLQRLAGEGRAVLAQHHPRKGTAKEFSHRGSGAITGFADVLMELTPPHLAATTDRRRWLRAVSRVGGPVARLIELSADGREYAVLAEPPPVDAFAAGWEVLRGVFEEADRRLTRELVLKGWPADFDRPHPATLRRWLEQAVAAGLLNRSGSGRRNSPFRYAVPGRAFDPMGKMGLDLDFRALAEAQNRSEYGNSPSAGVLGDSSLDRPPDELDPRPKRRAKPKPADGDALPAAPGP